MDHLKPIKKIWLPPTFAKIKQLDLSGKPDIL
jgi:hypothetical protein